MFKNLTREQAYTMWLTALRSGKYRQLQGQLKKGETSPAYCCLGVVGQVLTNKVKTIKWECMANGWSTLLGETYELPTEILSFLGLTHNEQMKLAALNDDKNKTFKEIADYIEFKLMPKALARPLKYRSR